MVDPVDHGHVGKVVIRIEPEAGDVDAIGVRVRAALVEGVGATLRAEVVLRRSRIELVQRQQVLALYDRQAVERRADSDRALHRADRAVAARAAQLDGQLDGETNRAAVTGTLALGHSFTIPMASRGTTWLSRTWCPCAPSCRGGASPD